MLPNDVTQEILDKIKPVNVFSGDNHDVCEVMHPTGAIEVPCSNIEISSITSIH